VVDVVVVEVVVVDEVVVARLVAVVGGVVATVRSVAVADLALALEDSERPRHDVVDSTMPPTSSTAGSGRSSRARTGGFHTIRRER
jgi:hypothetical protein